MRNFLQKFARIAEISTKVTEAYLLLNHSVRVILANFAASGFQVVQLTSKQNSTAKDIITNQQHKSTNSHAGLRFVRTRVSVSIRLTLKTQFRQS